MAAMFLDGSNSFSSYFCRRLTSDPALNVMFLSGLSFSYFCRGSRKHSCEVWLQLTQWYLLKQRTSDVSSSICLNFESLCFCYKLTFRAPKNKKICMDILHLNSRILGFRGGVFFRPKYLSIKGIHLNTGTYNVYSIKLEMKALRLHIIWI